MAPVARRTKATFVEKCPAETAVRSSAHALGLRFRLGGCGLPGKPHVVFPIHKLVVFVCECGEYDHECVRSEREWRWHRVRKTRAKELERFRHSLGHRGWRSEVVWACTAQDISLLRDQIRRITKVVDPQR